MEGLTFDNILDSEAAEHIFDDDYNFPEEKGQEEKPDDDKTEKDIPAEEIDGDELFSESVGREEKDTEEQEDAAPKQRRSSPSNFYSSIARAAMEDGIFTDLDDETIDKVETPEDFGQLLERQVSAMLDEKQKRIDAALTAGVPDSAIQSYERTLDYLDSLDEKNISGEDEASENIRKQLIFQDYINRGFTKERAQREVSRSLSSGTDVEDAKEALQSNREFFAEKYNSIIDAHEQERQEAIKQRQKEAENLKKDILEGKDIFDGLQIDKSTRQKVFDSISKPVYKDKETGQVFTEVQKYERENRSEFLKKIGLLYVLTDKFTSLDNLVGKQVKKEVRKGIRNLERTLNATQRDDDGNLRLMTGNTQDKESYSGFELDI